MSLSKLKTKIQSNSGVTIVFALIALIVCVMISAVIIYTAYSNVGRVKTTQTDEQNYLSVSSAVMLFKESIEGDSASFEQTFETVTEVDDETGETISGPTLVGPQPPPVDPKLPEPYNDVGPTNSIIKEVLVDWSKKIIQGGSSEPPLTITVTGNSNISKIVPIDVKMELEPLDSLDPLKGKIIATFKIEGADPAEDKYSTVMTMDLLIDTIGPFTSTSETKNGDIRTITVEKTYVHTISWENFVITKKK